MLRFFAFFFTVAFAVAAPAAPEPWHAHLSEAEFLELGVELAPRVDLFEEIWRADPTAQIYGGTARDFFWLLRAQFVRCTDRQCVERVRDRLRRQAFFAEEIVAPESDVDVIAARAPDISLRNGLITKIDAIDPAWFATSGWYAEQEGKQGGLPVEKIRLTPKGVLSPLAPALGGGVGEIYRGIPTLVLDPRITRTPLYEKKENHPLLLVLRYLRQVASAYFHRFGRGAVDPVLLESVVDKASWGRVESVLGEARRKPGSLAPFFANRKFRERAERVLKKSFRSFINPDAARALFRKAELDTLFVHYGDLAPQYQGVLFARTDDPRAIARARRASKRLGVVVTSLEDRVPPIAPGLGGATLSEDGASLLHGTDSDTNYRLICYQGILPSEGGTAGRGAYAVDGDGKSFAFSWKKTDKARVARLVFRPKTTLLDLTTIEPSVRSRLVRALGVVDTDDAVADALGADVVKYPYWESPTGAAYVIKNGAAILRSEPFSEDVRTFEAVRREMNAARSEPRRFAERFDEDPLLVQLFDALTDGWSPLERFQWARVAHGRRFEAQIPYGVAYAASVERADAELVTWMMSALRATAKDAPLEHLRCLLVFGRLLPSKDLADWIAELQSEKKDTLERALRADAKALGDFAEFVRESLEAERFSRRALARLGEFLYATVLAHVARVDDPTAWRPTLEKLDEAIHGPKRARAALRGSRLSGISLPATDVPRFFRRLFRDPRRHEEDIAFVVRQIVDEAGRAVDVPSPALPAVSTELARAPESFRVPFWDAVFRRCVELARGCDDRRIAPIVRAFPPPKARKTDGAAVLAERGRLALRRLQSMRYFEMRAQLRFLEEATALLAAEDPSAADQVETPFLDEYHLLRGSSLRDPREADAMDRRLRALPTSATALVRGMRKTYEPMLQDANARSNFIGAVQRDMRMLSNFAEPLRSAGTAYLREVLFETRRVCREAEARHPGEGYYRSGYVSLGPLQTYVPPEFRVFDLAELVAESGELEPFLRQIPLYEFSDTTHFRWEDVADLLVGWSRVPTPRAFFRDWRRYALEILKLESRAPQPAPAGWGRQLEKATEGMAHGHPLQELMPELSRWPSPPAKDCGEALAG